MPASIASKLGYQSAMTKKRKRAIFICFTGLDGSGKTTLAQALVTTLRGKGIESEYVYSRFQAVVAKPFMKLFKLLFLRGKDIFIDYNGYSNRKKRVFRNRTLAISGLGLFLFDQFLHALFKIKIPLMLGKNIVCDRYIYDTLITDIAVDFSYSSKKIARILKIYSFFLPKPDVVFLLDVPEEIACSRKKDIPSIDYLKDRREIYLDIGKQCNMVIMDGSKDPVQLGNIIFGYLVPIIKEHGLEPV